MMQLVSKPGFCFSSGQFECPWIIPCSSRAGQTKPAAVELFVPWMWGGCECCCHAQPQDTPGGCFGPSQLHSPEQGWIYTARGALPVRTAAKLPSGFTFFFAFFCFSFPDVSRIPCGCWCLGWLNLDVWVSDGGCPVCFRTSWL